MSVASCGVVANPTSSGTQHSGNAPGRWSRTGAGTAAGSPASDPDCWHRLRTPPSRQSSIRPVVPVHYRVTPAERVPFLMSPASSTTHTPSGAPRCSSTYPRKSSPQCPKPRYATTAASHPATPHRHTQPASTFPNCPLRPLRPIDTRGEARLGAWLSPARLLPVGCLRH